jgi:hypothetical protein
MSRHMAGGTKTQMRRTSLRLAASLLDEATQEAAKDGLTLTQFFEEGLRLAVKRRRERRHDPTLDRNWRLPVGVASDGGGLLVPIDFNNSAEMWDILDELDRQEKLESETRPDDPAGR